MTDNTTDQRDAAAIEFVASLGAAMTAASYPVTMIHDTMAATAQACGLASQFLALPNYVQVGSAGGTGLYIADTDIAMRYDQSFALAKLVAQAPTGSISPEDGLAELARIRDMRMRLPVWVTVIGYAVQSAGLSLILQPAPLSLLAATFFGLLVGALSVLGSRHRGLNTLLPTLSAFLVAAGVFVVHNHWHIGSESLRALAPPLATFLPGDTITLAVIELATKHVVSGASRLVAGFMQIAQLAFGILIATQLTGVADANLATDPVNRLGPWAPLVGVVVYAAGTMLHLGPPARFLPWMLVMSLTAYGGQWVGNAVLGSYASGFTGGLALIITALAISHRPGTPPTVSLVLPGFWLLVPGSLGFMGVTQLLGSQNTAVFAATLISMMSIAVGVQAGILLWRAAIHLTDTPHRQALHD